MSETPLLTATGLGVRLAGRVVLTDVSLALSSGHLVALVGPNGAGKTTLLRALAGLVPSEGAVSIGGDALEIRVGQAERCEQRARAIRLVLHGDGQRRPPFAIAEDVAPLHRGPLQLTCGLRDTRARVKRELV